MKKLFVIGLLFFASCAEPLKEGDVIAKRHEPASTFVYMMPIPHTNCTGGKNPICTTWYSYIPIWMYDDEDWVLTIQNGERKQEVYVSEEKYYCLKDGDHFTADENCSYSDTHAKVDK